MLLSLGSNLSWGEIVGKQSDNKRDHFFNHYARERARVGWTDDNESPAPFHSKQIEELRATLGDAEICEIISWVVENWEEATSEFTEYHERPDFNYMIMPWRFGVMAGLKSGASSKKTNPRIKRDKKEPQKEESLFGRRIRELKDAAK